MAWGQRDPALERRWRERVVRWSTRGSSDRAFCRQHGLVEASFYYWNREQQARDATVSPRRCDRPQEAGVLAEISAGVCAGDRAPRSDAVGGNPLSVGACGAAPGVRCAVTDFG